MSKLGEFLRKRREWTGKGLVQVAREMGLVDSSYSNIQAWEKGRAVPSVRNNNRLLLYAQALDLSVGEMTDAITKGVFPELPNRKYTQGKKSPEGRNVLPLIRACAKTSARSLSLSTFIRLVHLAGEIEKSTGKPITVDVVEALRGQIDE